MSRPNLMHPIIVSLSLAGSWLSLLLPIFLLTPRSYDFEAGETILDYSKYVVFAFILCCSCLAPILISGAYLIVKRNKQLTRIDRFFLCISYTPGLSLTALNLYIGVDGLTEFPSLILSAMLNLFILVYSTFCFPRSASS